MEKNRRPLASQRSAADTRSEAGAGRIVAAPRHDAEASYPTLTELANQYGSDKGTAYGHAHHYTLIYDVLFAPLRLECTTLLEIGLAIGGPEHGVFERHADSPSVAMWLAYFPRGQIHGFDYTDFSHQGSDRFDFHRGDCGVEADLAALARTVPPLDVVIDDASHASYHQQLMFRHLFPKTKPGGLYIIEDLFWQPPHYERSLPMVKRSTRVFHTILASDEPFANAVFSCEDVAWYRAEVEAFEFITWLGGPILAEDHPHAGPAHRAKLLVMRRRSGRSDA